MGDLVGIAGNHWDGFSKGRNRRLDRTGLFPSYKVQDAVDWVSFPRYHQALNLTQLPWALSLPPMNRRFLIFPVPRKALGGGRDVAAARPLIDQKPDSPPCSLDTSATRFGAVAGNEAWQKNMPPATRFSLLSTREYSRPLAPGWKLLHQPTMTFVISLYLHSA